MVALRIRLWACTLLIASVSLGGRGPVVYAQLNPGDILVVDGAAGTGGLGMLFQVNPGTGTRSLLSDFGNPAQGPTGDNPLGVAVEAGGTILVVDLEAGTGGLGALFRVDPGTGARSLLSDFGNPAQGPTGYTPTGVAVEAGGTLMVVDRDAGAGLLGALFRVDPGTGARSLLSDFGDPALGPTGVDPAGIGVEAGGTILVVDVAAGTGGLGALFRVDPGTGARSLLSDFGDPALGLTGNNPRGVAVVPTQVPFSSFAAAVDLTYSPLEQADAFAMGGLFALGSGSDGMNPLVEVVGLQVGAFATVIPAGAFSQDATGQFTFAGVIGAATVNMVIQPLGGGSFEFSATASGVDLTGSRTPVTVGLTIGNDSGTAVLATGTGHFE
jgi:hypothetical protein